MSLKVSAPDGVKVMARMTIVAKVAHMLTHSLYCIQVVMRHKCKCGSSCILVILLVPKLACIDAKGGFAYRRSGLVTRNESSQEAALSAGLQCHKWKDAT